MNDQNYCQTIQCQVCSDTGMVASADIQTGSFTSCPKGCKPQTYITMTTQNCDGSGKREVLRGIFQCPGCPNCTPALCGECGKPVCEHPTPLKKADKRNESDKHHIEYFCHGHPAKEATTADDIKRAEEYLAAGGEITEAEHPAMCGHKEAGKELNAKERYELAKRNILAFAETPGGLKSMMDELDYELRETIERHVKEAVGPKEAGRAENWEVEYFQLAISQEHQDEYGKAAWACSQEAMRHFIRSQIAKAKAEAWRAAIGEARKLNGTLVTDTSNPVNAGIHDGIGMTVSVLIANARDNGVEV